MDNGETAGDIFLFDHKNIKISSPATIYFLTSPIFFSHMLDLSPIIHTPFQWAVAGFCAFIIGMSKTGVQGITTLSIPLLALLFGGKPSTGIILPLLCMADVMAVIYYRRNAEWKYIFKLLPAAIAGFFVALAADRFVPEAQFKRLMAVCILAGIAVMLLRTRSKNGENALIRKWWYGPSFGLLGGFTTMIGNAAGPVMSVYLLSVRLPKYAFVGTSAWFFLIVNFLKIPLQVFVWDNISAASLLLDVMLLPLLALGAVAGVALVKRMPEHGYRKMIVVLTVLSTAMLLI